jgi:hypothetical protein
METPRFFDLTAAAESIAESMLAIAVMLIPQFWPF